MCIRDRDGCAGHAAEDERGERDANNARHLGAARRAGQLAAQDLLHKIAQHARICKDAHDAEHRDHEANRAQHLSLIHISAQE